jgi:hypothetical protein
MLHPRLQSLVPLRLSLWLLLHQLRLLRLQRLRNSVRWFPI